MSISKLKQKCCQLGQGMSEYLIVIALVAVAGISVVGFLGGALNLQLASVAQEVAGNDGAPQTASAGTEAGKAASAATSKTLANYSQ